MFGLALSVGARLHPVTIGKLACPMTRGRTSGGDRNQSATFAPLAPGTSPTPHRSCFQPLRILSSVTRCPGHGSHRTKLTRKPDAANVLRSNVAIAHATPPRRFDYFYPTPGQVFSTL